MVEQTKTNEIMNKNELSKKAHANAVEKGFWRERKGNEHCLMLVVTEISEMVEADRKGRYHYQKQFLSGEPPKVEEWKGVVGYEDDYEVSNLGNVRSNNLEVWNGKVFYHKKSTMLKPGLGGTGYNTVALRGKTHKVAKLVADAFIGKIDDGCVINHIDGNKLNDNVCNLEYVSYGENNSHAIKSGLRGKQKSEKLTYEQRVEISFLKKSGIGYTMIFNHKDYGVSKSVIQKVCNNHEKYTDSVEFEFADVAIRLGDLAGSLGVDFDKLQPCRYYRAFDRFSFTENAFALVKGLSKDMICIEKRIQFGLFYIEEWSKHLGINLDWHIEQKMKYNQSREIMHGKKY